MTDKLVEKIVFANIARPQWEKGDGFAGLSAGEINTLCQPDIPDPPTEQRKRVEKAIEDLLTKNTIEAIPQSEKDRLDGKPVRYRLKCGDAK